ncbi:MAG: S4 domain-containing protein [archaeon]
MHLKRQKTPKKWPTPRKGTAYIVRPSFNLKSGIPLLVVLRDMLKISQNRREAKKAILSGSVLLNGKKLRDESQGVSLFDTITIVPQKKYYRIVLSENKKFKMEEISEKESFNKVSKIINKRTLNKKKMQINLSDGNNFLSDMKCKVNDSVLINLKDKKIEKCLPLEEKAEVMIFDGKHTGETGTINKINEKNKMVELNINWKTVNALIKQIMVVNKDGKR